MVNDFGVLNPLIVEGQAHGGIVQGIGQALLERAVYDEAGQLLSGSFMDYAHAARRRRAVFRFVATRRPRRPICSASKAAARPAARARCRR